jgi:carboxyl-terminal processing protease
MSRRNLTLLLIAVIITTFCVVRSEHNPYARYASLGYRLIDDNALQQPTDEELIAGAMRGMVSVLQSKGDEHSDYFEPRRAKPLQDEMRQEFGGVGIRIDLQGEPPLVTVVEPPKPGTPAYRVGVRSGDKIIGVDGESIEGLPIDVAIDRMRGPVGKSVSLSVRRDGVEAPLVFKIIREVIRVPSVIGDLPLEDGDWQYRLEDDPQIALVRVTTFGNRTTEELHETLDSLVNEGVRGVVLDVRGNAGGAVDTAIGVAELFLKDGDEIFSTRGPAGEVLDEFDAVGDGPFLGLVLAVLIDQDSASASELVAAALQDHGRAVVVGERSYGKGTVQQILEIDGKGALLKLTTASFWRPSGEQIHRSPDKPVGSAGGVSPDEGFEVSLNDQQREQFISWRRSRDLLREENAPVEEGQELGPLEADPALSRAVEYVRLAL